MVIKTLEDAEMFVAHQQGVGNDVYWNNYDINFFTPDERAQFYVSGAYRNGQWGFKNVSMLQSDGTWKVDRRNVRVPIRTRN